VHSCLDIQTNLLCRSDSGHGRKQRNRRNCPHFSFSSPKSTKSSTGLKTPEEIYSKRPTRILHHFCRRSTACSRRSEDTDFTCRRSPRGTTSKPWAMRRETSTPGVAGGRRRGSARSGAKYLRMQHPSRSVGHRCKTHGAGGVQTPRTDQEQLSELLQGQATISRVTASAHPPDVRLNGKQGQAAAEP